MFNEDGSACILDQPEVAEALTPLVEMYQEGLSPSIDATTQTSGDDIFISGKIAMIPAGIWKVPSYNNITQTSHIKNGVCTLKNQYFSAQNSNQAAFCPYSRASRMYFGSL